MKQFHRVVDSSVLHSLILSQNMLYNTVLNEILRDKSLVLHVSFYFVLSFCFFEAKKVVTSIDINLHTHTLTHSLTRQPEQNETKRNKREEKKRRKLKGVFVY